MRRVGVWCFIALILAIGGYLGGKYFHKPDSTPTDLRSADVQSHYLDERQVKPSNAPVAVVFVHGIFGDDTTWGQGEVTLPKLLASDPVLGNSVDVFLFEYFSPYLGNANKITDLAEQLRGDLDYYGIWDHKKVIFVAHSMGGLIVRQFLVAHNGHAKQVPMMYFYAVPTSGAAIADVARKILRNPQLNGMIPQQNSDFIDAVINDWMGSEPLKSIRTYCAFEGLETGGVMIVPESSARTLCTESADPLTANHIQIIKPKNGRDPKYLRLATAVVTTLREMPVVVTTVSSPGSGSAPNRKQPPSSTSMQQPSASTLADVPNRNPPPLDPQDIHAETVTRPTHPAMTNSGTQPVPETTKAAALPAVTPSMKITPDLVKGSLRRYVSTEKFPHSKNNVYWYVWLELPTQVQDQVAAATYKFEDDFIRDPIDSDVNPARGAARFGAYGCDADGTVTVTLEDKTKVAANFNLCRVRIETNSSAVPR